MKQVTMDELMKEAGADSRIEQEEWRTLIVNGVKKVRPSFRQNIEAAIERTGATHLVLFKNQQFDSSQFGSSSVLCVGPSCTYKTVEECEGQHLNDLPSQREYAELWCEVAKEESN